MVSALGQGAKVRGIVPVATLTILDIEEGINGPDVVAVLCGASAALKSEDVQFLFLKAGMRGTQLATVSMPAKAAAKEDECREMLSMPRYGPHGERMPQP